MAMKISVTGRIVAAIILLTTQSVMRTAVATEIKVLASPGVRGAISELLLEFETSTGHKIVADFAVIAVLKRRIDAGEKFELVIPSPALIDDLIKQGKVAADTRTPFGRAGLGVAIAKDVPKPDISTPENFKHALLNAQVVAYSKEGASGTNFLAVLKSLGIAAEMQPKLRPFSGGGAFQQSDVDLAVSGIGPAMQMPGSDYVGPLPSEVQRYVTFAAGISTTTEQPEAARALLRFLTAPIVAPAFKAKGLEAGVN